jgi:hypothetical protein
MVDHDNVALTFSRSQLPEMLDVVGQWQIRVKLNGKEVNRTAFEVANNLPSAESE